MKTDNELIAEFMELEYSPDPFVESKKKYWHYGKILVMSDSLHFDTSWDWLMPVVQRIYKLYDEFDFQTIAQENKFLDVLDNPVKYPLSDTYRKVVEFIKWYNSQK